MSDRSAGDTSPVYGTEGFEGLYRTHLDAVFRYAWRCVGRREIAEEITSEAFLALYRNLDHIRSEELPGWLLTVAKNRAADYWRRQTVERRYVASAPPAEPSRGLPDEGRLFDSPVLKPIHRVCLVLRYAHGPQQPTPIQWPGPRGSSQVRLQIEPKRVGAESGLVFEGPWALFRLLDRAQIDAGTQPERFNVTFRVDGRRAVFEVVASSVLNPFKMRELEQFQCPGRL